MSFAETLSNKKMFFPLRTNLHEEEVLSLKTCQNNRHFYVNSVKVLGFFKQYGLYFKL